MVPPHVEGKPCSLLPFGFWSTTPPLRDKAGELFASRQRHLHDREMAMATLLRIHTANYARDEPKHLLPPTVWFIRCQGAGCSRSLTRTLGPGRRSSGKFPSRQPLSEASD